MGWVPFSVALAVMVKGVLTKRSSVGPDVEMSRLIDGGAGAVVVDEDIFGLRRNVMIEISIQM